MTASMTDLHHLLGPLGSGHDPDALHRAIVEMAMIGGVGIADGNTLTAPGAAPLDVASSQCRAELVRVLERIADADAGSTRRCTTPYGRCTFTTAGRALRGGVADFLVIQELSAVALTTVVLTAGGRGADSTAAHIGCGARFIVGGDPIREINPAVAELLGDVFTRTNRPVGATPPTTGIGDR